MNCNIINDLIDMILEEQKFQLVFRRERQIGSRVIQVGGVDKESILIFKKPERGARNGSQTLDD